MKSRTRWMLLALGLLAGLGAAALAVAALIPGSDELAARLAAQARARIGVKVKVAAVHWQIFPWPALAIDGVATEQAQPISFTRLIARPQLRALLHGQIVLDHLQVDGGVLPQLSLGALRIAPGEASTTDALPLARLTFRDVTWITRHGLALEFDGEVDFDPQWRPRLLTLERPGVQPEARLVLTRDGSQDHWAAQVKVGGGTADGDVTLKTAGNGALQLSGTLAPRAIEVDAALTAFKRHSAVRGRASGGTTLAASGNTLAELARSLHTRTQFTIAPATLLHIDVDKAIRSAGQAHGGQTALKSLTGQMDTQNSASGMAVQYSLLDARGDTFSATGGGTIANRRIDGEVTVDLLGGLVGVPLKIHGPLAAPQVTVPTSALAGAAIGTAVLPGIGTVIGARVGAALGNLFGGDTKPPAVPAR